MRIACPEEGLESFTRYSSTFPPTVEEMGSRSTCTGTLEDWPSRGSRCTSLATDVALAGLVITCFTREQKVLGITWIYHITCYLYHMSYGYHVSVRRHHESVFRK